MKNVTLSVVGGKVFVSIQTEREVELPMHPSTSVVGLDWGVRRFYTLSNGASKNQLAPLQKLLPRLAQLQRRLAKKEKFSSNWKKAKARISKLHRHIANIRKDFLHQVSNDISKNHAVVMMENLQVRNMSKSAKGTKTKPGKQVARKGRLNRAILDASPFELRRQLEYKLVWRGGRLIPVPPQNTSRRCPECGHVAKQNRPTQEQFSCVACGFSAHADWVAAWNIREAGLALLACGVKGPQDFSAKQEPTEGRCAA